MIKQRHLVVADQTVDARSHTSAKACRWHLAFLVRGCSWTTWQLVAVLKRIDWTIPNLQSHDKDGTAMQPDLFTTTSCADTCGPLLPPWRGPSLSWFGRAAAVLLWWFGFSALRPLDFSIVRLLHSPLCSVRYGPGVVVHGFSFSQSPDCGDTTLESPLHQDGAPHPKHAHVDGAALSPTAPGAREPGAHRSVRTRQACRPRHQHRGTVVVWDSRMSPSPWKGHNTSRANCSWFPGSPGLASPVVPPPLRVVARKFSLGRFLRDVQDWKAMASRRQVPPSLGTSARRATMINF